jgi:sortase A
MGGVIKRVLPLLLFAAGTLLVVQAGSSLYFWAGPALPTETAETKTAETAETTETISRPKAVQPLEEGAYVGTLLIPRFNAVMAVRQGERESTLRRGPGHLPSTPLPGEAGNSVIAGHRDTHFYILKDIQIGDDIVIQQNSVEFRYRVRHTEVVKPTDTQVLLPTIEPTLTLITCYPFYFIGPAPRRFVVVAELLESQ